MKAGIHAACAGVALALAAVTLTPTVASASHTSRSTLGPTIRNVQFHWIPGTGGVRVSGVATCAKRVFNASWTVEMSQNTGGDHASRSLRCDGKSHVVQLKLDPKKGRFHPGRAALAQSTMGCESDFCWGLVADGYTTIDRPGKAKGPRGRR